MTQEIVLTEELAKNAERFGYMGLFAHRASEREAYRDAVAMIEALEDKAGAFTALMILVNTSALVRAQQGEVVAELRELARATKAYCEQDSRSDRRRRAVISGANLALEHATEQFGPEE